jgi:hypothetical protein
MRVVLVATGVFFLFSRVLCADTVHVIGTENIPKMMASSDLVCKGEVVEAPEPVFSAALELPRRTATAIVRADRCFKGQPPANQFVPVLFDHILPSGGTTGGRIYVVFRRGEYCLYFLKSEGDKYILVNDGTGRLPTSRNLAADGGNKSDPMQMLEMDLKAGLTDSDHDRVLYSIRMLGNMRHLQSEAELISLLDSQDMLVRTFTYQALLRLHDYSVLPCVEEWLVAQPPPPDPMRMATPSLERMQFGLVAEIAAIRDPAYLPVMDRLLSLPTSNMRRQILDGIRAIHSQQSATTLLRVLDDPDTDMGFIAMQSLIELAGGGPIEWVPSFDEFRLNRAHYSAICRQWWQAKHPQE